MEKRKDEFIDFNCPHCEVRLRAKRAQGGKKGPCPRCRYIIRIPKD
jgi:Zn-finger nucleic acid-binding protein